MEGELKDRHFNDILSMAGFILNNFLWDKVYINSDSIQDRSGSCPSSPLLPLECVFLAIFQLHSFAASEK